MKQTAEHYHQTILLQQLQALEMVISGIVGGTASAMGGDKFSNGAMSGAFTHMFNAEARASISVSGGAGKGGTMEIGGTIAHDNNNHVSDIGGVSTTVGASGDVGGFINVGFETSIPQSSNFSPSYNMSVGVYGNPFVPGESHVYITNTQVHNITEW